ncbi:methionine ABC transporter ATP-binding protein [Melissococcus plutonius]|uniref:Methionine ABC transporter ATP-binding protein n=1 Tax=Melissococcus plutonius (strain ATCC 35311 / DSM 29964 / CIP 104052 / LMG 20360 / NCIMB 702443) TaxID=940190 RepID=F3YBU0_MELPT|nr:methionine ABC transporter ATP-binding protein [Melissococcus plutonius]AIM25243.1 methionine import ATP-binding protein MetN 2 [Melissococcus plutonius S1]KMT23924.1 methionine import ATP-binding protein MetN 2 [Melissococcus plutonius]KMT24447.1 methionine import ATP-binding protein MetN 2 [Melissococcus plutonius]KMT26020.1 methionine import ATP-binding protein MetN 2 [Melissococcus plutonius]KMT28569.1 methionine import ATP-binding protein MetN 2 [Melissococcus plutonius]
MAYIELKNVNKIFSTKAGKVKALNNISLEINQGDIYGIIGYSGAGKSTLVRLLNGLEFSTNGEVIVQKQNVKQLSSRELRQFREKIGMIFQHFNLLWSRTVLENILLPLEIAGIAKSERKTRAAELVNLVGLKGKETAYPSQLSGGQKQRVGIARALANEPKILLCDEATSALDPQTTDEILELLLKINQTLNLTIVLITHEMHVIQKICNHVAVMENGQVIEAGNVIDIFKKPKTEVTKRFVMQETDGDREETEGIINELLKQYPQGSIVRLTFHGEQVKLPIISQLIKKYEVDISIIYGNINQTKQGAIGSLYIQLLGEEENIKKTIQALQRFKVETEVIDHE